jgi:hypothetical protein
MTKMVNGLLPDGTLIRACEVTFGYLEKQDDRIEKLKAALRKIKDLHHGPEDEEVVIIRDDMTYFIVCEALGETA